MKVTKILGNNNALCREVHTDTWQAKQSDDFSFRFVFEGNEKFTVGNRQLILYPTNFLVLNEGTVYSRRICSDIPAETFSIFFDPHFLQDFHLAHTGNDESLLNDPFSPSKCAVPHFLEALYAFTGDMKFNIMHLKKHFDAGLDNEMLINEYLNHSLMIYYRIYEKEVVSTSNNLQFFKEQTKTEILRRLVIARDYIHSNYNSPITLEDISQQSYLSINHLLRTFKQAFHCSPYQYLIRVRLNRARYLLRHSTYSVKEIVNLVGFECPSSFIRLFKKSFQVTPGRFRNGVMEVA